MKSFPPLFIALCAGAGGLSAAIKPAMVFQDYAVLQQGMPVPVWGSAAPGQTITVTYEAGAVSSTATAPVDAGGRWRAELPALKVSDTPGTLTLSGDGTVVLKDILVGEVWLASGQSNMEWMVRDSANASEEATAADFPAIRMLKIPRRAADEPRADVEGSWKVCDSTSVKTFSAVAYFFARDLHRKFDGIPVGIIDSTWGGTPIEPWMDSATLAFDPSFTVAVKRWDARVAAWPEAKRKYDEAVEAWQIEEAAAKAAGTPFKKPRPGRPYEPYRNHQPSVLYNAMIHPLTPAALRGVIWYQGEANVGRADEYRRLFPAMIGGWRTAFGQQNLPFYFVQLANYGNRGRGAATEYSELREAQDAALGLPHTGRAIAIDVGSTNSIHPTNKQAVGHRLALLALRRTYGRTATVDSGPEMAKVDFNAGGPRLVRVVFDHVDGGLVNRSEPPEVEGFEIAGADKRFQPAEATIEDPRAGTVLLQVPDAVTAPTFVRYAWRNDPANTLSNAAGLPAAPFRTDR